MKDHNRSMALNKANWDERAPLHAASAEYDVEAYIDDPRRISGTLRFDQPLLGDIRGLRGIHLQCHIGTDTISLARLGASMTGLDFSPASLAQARALAERAETTIRYVESEVYTALDVIEPASFDFVYTGIGALCWLPEIDRWAATVSALLRPGGWLFLREIHPLLSAVNEKHADMLVVEYPYFEQKEPTVWDDPSTYVRTETMLQAAITHEWNHGLAEIVTAVLTHGMELVLLREHDCVPYEALPGRMVMTPDGEWRLAREPRRMPLTFTLRAVKK